MDTAVDVYEQIEMRILWPPAPARWTPITRLILGLWGFGMLSLEGLLGHGTFKLVFRTIVPPAIGGIAFISWLGVGIAW